MTLDEVRRNCGSHLHSKGQWGVCRYKKGMESSMLRYCCLGMTDDYLV